MSKTQSKSAFCILIYFCTSFLNFQINSEWYNADGIMDVLNFLAGVLKYQYYKGVISFIVFMELFVPWSPFEDKR